MAIGDGVNGAGCLARFCSRSSSFRDRRAPDYATRQLRSRSGKYGAVNFGPTLRLPQSALRVVAREGTAPSTSGCKPDVMLFHHRAVEARPAKTGCRGWICTGIRAFKGRCPTIRRPGNDLVEPEVVATSPNRIKSPVPVSCGFGSVRWPLSRNSAGEVWCSRQGLHLHWRRSQRRVSSIGLREQEMDPPAGAAPAGLHYRCSPQAAAWRRSKRRGANGDHGEVPQCAAKAVLSVPQSEFRI